MKDYQDEVIRDLKENHFNDFKVGFDQLLINFIQSRNYILKDDICNIDIIIDEIKEDYLLRILKLK